MTKAEIIKMLMPFPDEAVVRIFDADSERMEEVSGCVSGPETGSGYTIDLHSDDIS